MVSSSSLPKEDNHIDALIPRLLEYAPQYYDLSGFPDGETKRMLVRAANKRSRNASAMDGGSSKGKDTRPSRRARQGSDKSSIADAMSELHV